MSDKREWTAERHAAAKDLGSLSGDGKRDALAEIERLAKVLGDAHAALDVEIGRGDKATGRVFTLAERIGFVLSGLREETKRADDAEDKVDRQAREIERLKVTRATAEAERDDARRLVTLERRVGRWMSTEDEEALRRLRQEAREWDGSKVDPPVRHARHDRHCMIGDGGGCSHEPGCEVER